MSDQTTMTQTNPEGVTRQAVRDPEPVADWHSGWAQDPDGTWRNGAFLIALEDDDPRRWYVQDTGTGSRVTQGPVPRTDVGSPSDFGAALDYQLAGELSTQGLEPWCAHAELLAHDRYMEEDARRERTVQEELGHLPGRLASELEAEVGSDVEFLVPGLLVPSWLTKVAAREKVGKGTLAYYIVGKLERDEPTVFGAGAGRPVTTLILSEEPAESTMEKVKLFGVEKARIVWGWEMAGMAWREKADYLVKIAVLEGHEVIFLDNISRATGIEDEAGTELARAIEYLQDRCRELGIAVWIDHHHKKGRASDEDKSRGSTSIAGAADINVEMFRQKGQPRSRERRLRAIGRVRATTWQSTIELSEDGTDYWSAADDGDEVDDASQRHLLDLMTLRKLGTATKKEFAVEVGLKESTARHRLDALVDAGSASMEKDKRGRTRVNVYRPAREE